MSEAKVIFTLDGIDLTIQCSLEDKLRDICQKYVTKIESNINSLFFLYGGNQIDMELRFKEQANSLDISNKKMRVLVYRKEVDNFTCPHCGEKIKLNTEKLDEIVLSNNNIQESINGVKLTIENIVKLSSVNNINIQLKNINVLLNNINEDIKKNNQKIKILFNETNNTIINENQNKVFHKLYL